MVADEMVDGLSQKLGVQLQRLGTLSGAELAGCQYRHPLFERCSPVLVGGDYITTESGTGLVHTAPGHGQEDYQVGTLSLCLTPANCTEGQVASNLTPLCVSVLPLHLPCADLG